MKKRSLFLAILFPLCGLSQEHDYVPDVSASTGSLTSRVVVKPSQIPSSSGVICSYRVTNGAARPIYMFQVGAASTVMKGLPAQPLHWNRPSPGATPAGWFETVGSAPGGYPMGWQARTSKDMIEPGGSREFAFEFPRTEGFQCAAANTTARFAAVYPPIEVPPTTLSMTLSNLQSTGKGQFEGDVSIQNLGPNDAVLNLGVSLGNGSQSYPDKLTLVARGPDGALHKLFFMGMGAVAGRLDPMIVPMPKGSAYTVHGRWWGSDVPAGKVVFFVEFEGTPARNANLDMPGMNLMKCWLGKLISNEVTLTVP